MGKYKVLQSLISKDKKLEEFEYLKRFIIELQKG